MIRFLALFLFALILTSPSWAADAETAYDRVMRTGVLRCAYIVYTPETIKDPNTGRLYGNTVDAVELAAKQLDLKVDWVTEVGFGDMFDGLYSGKYDALCSGLWESPPRARHALFSIPINYGVYYAFVRADDHRFDDDLSKINDPAVRIAIIDGEYGETVAKESYPKAELARLPQLSDISQELMMVQTKKADVAFMQVSAGQGFIDHNPGVIRRIHSHPVRVMPAPPMAFAVDEQKLKNLFDASFRFLLNNGNIERIIRTYDPKLESYNLIAKPYQE